MYVIEVGMKDRSAIISKFKQIGIGEREAKIYLALLEHGESSAIDVHRISGLQRNKIYTVLPRMVVHGLCTERIEGKKRFFVAVRPKVVFDTLAQNWETETKHLKEQANTTMKEMESLFPLTNHNRTFLDSVEVIRNNKQIQLHYLSLLKSSEKEILAFNRQPYAASDESLANEQLTAQREALDRGVKTRAIIMLGHKPYEDFEFEKMDENDEIRYIESLPLKLFIFDSQKVLLPIPSNPESEIGNFSMLSVDDAGLASSLRTTFEHYWEKASLTAEEYNETLKVSKK